MIYGTITIVLYCTIATAKVFFSSWYLFSVEISYYIGLVIV